MRGSCAEMQDDLAEITPSRKASLPLKPKRPYRKPTQVGGDQSPKVIEIIFVKELGNLAPYVSNKGCPGGRKAFSGPQ